MISAFIEEGLSKEEARSRLWFVDQNGLVVQSRDDLMAHNLPYAHDHEALDFIGAMGTINRMFSLALPARPALLRRKL